MSCDSMYRELDKVKAALKTECGGDWYKDKACSKLGQRSMELERKLDSKCGLNGLAGAGRRGRRGRKGLGCACALGDAADGRTPSGGFGWTLAMLGAGVGFIWWLARGSKAKAQSIPVAPPVAMPSREF